MISLSKCLCKHTFIQEISGPITWLFGKFSVCKDWNIDHTRFSWFKANLQVQIYQEFTFTGKVIDGKSEIKMYFKKLCITLTIHAYYINYIFLKNQFVWFFLLTLYLLTQISKWMEISNYLSLTTPFTTIVCSSPNEYVCKLTLTENFSKPTLSL